MTPRVHLLLIDPQNDFCDLPDAYCPPDPRTGARLRPALPVPGAHADMQRTARLIREGAAAFTDITVTLDSHQQLDIAHPAFWCTNEGEDVVPFTPIPLADFEAGRFRPRDAARHEDVRRYLQALEAGQRYTLMVWPLHCEIGTWGHNVHADVRDAYAAWERQQQRSVLKVIKGENVMTEHYSAVQAEVPDPQDPATGTNYALIRRLLAADEIVIAGEAASHCVRATVEHLADHLPTRSFTLLTDCMSPVTGFVAQQEAFLANMQRQGATLTDSQTLLRRLAGRA